jgi:hypothetical protein
MEAKRKLVNKGGYICPFLIFLVKVEAMANLWIMLCNPEHQLIAQLFYHCNIVLPIVIL